MPTKVYVLILSYRNAPDTIECLESVLRLDYPDFEVIVCDNASPDGALDALLEWASGARPARPAAEAMRRFSAPPVAKPVSHRLIEAAGIGPGPSDPGVRLTFIRGATNRGYAGGNNVGLRHIQERGDASFVWVLNNDTVVEKGALAEVVARARADQQIGLCGSLVRYYHQPDHVQAYGGGRYNPWLGISHYMTAPAPTGSLRLDYVLGAATLVSREFLEKVGLMEEGYFLYFEELDWAERGKRAGFRLDACPASIIYHKEGASTGIAQDPRKKSPLADYYVMRNRVVFARRFRPWTRPTIYAGVVLSLLLRLARGQRRNARVIGRLLLDLWGHGLPPAEQHPVQLP